MVSKAAIIIVLLLTVTVALFSDTLTLEYLDGFLELDSGSGWREAQIGDRVPVEAYVRLEQGGIAEFSGADITVTISQEGTFLLKDLMEGASEVSSWGIGSLIDSRLKTLSGEKQVSQEAVMGVRGAAGDEQELTWMDWEGDEDPKERGDNLLKEGRYDEAGEAFQEAYGMCFDSEEKEELLFNIACAYSLGGRNAQALAILSGINPGSGKAYYHNFVLLKGNLLLEVLSFRQALDLFDSYLRGAPEGEAAQAVHFLSFFCYQQLGLEEKALQALSAAVRLDASSDIGNRAERMLAERK